MKCESCGKRILGKAKKRCYRVYMYKFHVNCFFDDIFTMFEEPDGFDVGMAAFEMSHVGPGGRR